MLLGNREHLAHVQEHRYASAFSTGALLFFTTPSRTAPTTVPQAMASTH